MEMGERDAAALQVNSEDKNMDWLIKEIDNYVDDESHRYAIAIEGDWGSGKTRFLETVVKPHLKKRRKKKVLVRVSMFGVANAAGLHDRIAKAILCLNDAGKSKLKTTAKAVGSVASDAVSTVTSTLGISLNMRPDTELFSTLISCKQHLFVFDDVERRADDADDLGLFGVINDMVEGRGLKAIIVTNSLGKDGNDGDDIRQFDKDIREKLVWRAFAFNPSPSFLARSIFNEPDGGSIDSDTVDVICEAASLAECHNARAMIRASAFVNDLYNVPTFSNRDIPIDNRKAAFRDGVRLALLCCMGKRPEKPMEREAEKDFTAMLFNEHLRDLYALYSDFSCVSRYFDSKARACPIDLDGGFREYLAIRYPDSSDTLAIRAIQNRLRDVGSMTDEDLLPLTREFSEVICRAEFSPHAVREALSVYRSFCSIDFDLPIEEQRIVDCCQQVIKQSPSQALESLIDLDFYFEAGDVREIVYKLRDFANEMCAEQMRSVAASDFENATQAIEYFNKICEKDYRQIVRIPPDIFAGIFADSTPYEQNELRGFFISLASRISINGRGPEAFIPWLSEIESNMREISIESKTDDIRRKWLVQQIEKMKKSV